MKPTLLIALLPTLASCATLQVNFFSEPGCKGSKQTYTIGKLAACHNPHPFKSYGTANVDSSFFKRGIALSTWSSPGCNFGVHGTGEDVGLTNGNNCHTFGKKSLPDQDGWVGQSFKVRDLDG
jgi:hypothetical protein